MYILDIVMEMKIGQLGELFKLYYDAIYSNRGTFTPVAKNCTISYTEQAGMYYKIGYFAYIALRITGTISAVSGEDKAAVIDISDLPLSILNTYGGTSMYASASMRTWTSETIQNVVWLTVIPLNKTMVFKKNGLYDTIWTTGTLKVQISGFWVTNT